MKHNRNRATIALQAKITPLAALILAAAVPMRANLSCLLLAFSLLLTLPLRAQTLIGTYNVNYRYNAAGCYGGGDFGPTQGNPYFCPSGFPPGPIFVASSLTPPGRYQIVDTTVSHMAVWVGNQAGGTRYEPAGGTINFTLTQGQSIVLYYWDWVVSDNSPNDFTVVKLYSLPQNLIGTYNVNYRNNAAGCYAGGDVGPTQGNPYFCPSGFPPGPIFVDNALTPPGRYRVVDTTVSHMAIWVGNQAGGTRYEPAGGTVDFTLTQGQSIVLYYWDWFVSDNSPNDFTTVQLYSLPACTYSTSSTTLTAPPAGMIGMSVGVITQAGCAWTAVSNVPWILITTPNGTGPGQAKFDVAANNTGVPRSGPITVAGVNVTVSQDPLPCTFAVSPMSISLPSNAGASGSISVTAGTGCTWTATSNANWVTVSPGAGTGNGSVSFTVTLNPDATQRTAILTIAGKMVTVTQPGQNCTITLSPSSINAPASGGTFMVTVNTSPAGCPWSVSVPDSWLVINSGFNGTGTGTVSFTVLPNPSVNPRNTILTIGGVLLPVTQATSGPLRFSSLAPCRVMETRPEYNFPVKTGSFGPPFMTAGETRTLNLPTSTACAIPAAAKAYVVNVTLVPHGSVDFATVFPAGDARPTFRTISSPDGQTVANAAIVKAGVSGGISVYTAGNADVLIDIAGYFTDDTALSNLVFYPIAPCRIVETRPVYQDPLIAGTLFGRPFLNDQESRTYPFLSSQKCAQGIPSTVAAYAVTLTVVPPNPLAYVTTWPTGGSQPGVSSINSFLGRILANSVILPAGVGGSIDVFAYNKTDILMDITGYFAPDNGTGLFYYPVTQCRAADSTLYADDTVRTIAVPTAQGCSGIPSSAKAYAVNVTAIPNGNPMPFITAYPTGQPRPGASILNAFEGQTVTNSAITPTGTNGSIDVYAFRRTNVIVEISGYFGR